MAPASLRRAPALLLLLLLLPGGIAAAAGTGAGSPGEPPIPDSATGAGAEAPPAPSPERVAPAPTPTPAATRPERPALLPREVPVGDLALQARASGAGEAAAGPLAPLHYPLAVAASEQTPGVGGFRRPAGPGACTPEWI